MNHKPTETQYRAIKVKKLWKRRRETIEVSSIEEAINEIKETHGTVSCTKIILNGDVVYTSDRHEIDDWENEWKRQKRILSVDKVAHDCPFGNDYCYEDSLCSKCKMKIAREGAID